MRIVNVGAGACGIPYPETTCRGTNYNTRLPLKACFQGPNHHGRTPCLDGLLRLMLSVPRTSRRARRPMEYKHTAHERARAWRLSRPVVLHVCAMYVCSIDCLQQSHSQLFHHVHKILREGPGWKEEEKKRQARCKRVAAERHRRIRSPGPL